ncbi:hypothetical protein ACQKGI_13195 [Peribacillus muralis]
MQTYTAGLAHLQDIYALIEASTRKLLSESHQKTNMGYQKNPNE